MNEGSNNINIQGIRIFFTGWKPRQGSTELCGQWYIEFADGIAYELPITGVYIDTPKEILAAKHRKALTKPWKVLRKKR
jgi:hypothetical protein